MTGTLTLGDMRPANGVAGHIAPPAFRPEPFTVYAAAELSVSAPWVKGQCFNPACGRAFAPSRDWQIYCCAPCEAASVAEMRRWGHRMALPLLVWRMGKYEARDEGLRDVARAARRYVGHVQSAWVADRDARHVKAGRGS